MKTSFKTQQAAGPEATSSAVAETPSAPATVPEPPAPTQSQVPAQYAPANPFEGPSIQGEIEIGDLKLPRINFVQKSGDLSDSFEFGAILFNKEVVIGDEANAFEFTLLTIKKQYQEDLPYKKDGPTPRVFNKAEEVRAAGGSLRYGDDGYYAEMATALVLVKAPENAEPDTLETHFFYEFEGQHYALALWTLAKSAYNACAKKLITAGTMGHLKGGNFTKGKWTCKSLKKSGNGNTWVVPEVKTAGMNTPEFQKFVHDCLSAQ